MDGNWRCRLVQLIELPLIWIIIIDSIAWAIFQLSISFFTLSLPERYFQKQTFIYPARKWENEGQFWQTHFDIKNWAKIIPDGTRILKKGFYKKNLQQKEANYLETFILETKRAELTHWLSIIPSFLFFLWNPVWLGWIMVIYALLFNVPIILVQRYNRPRFERVLNRKNTRQ